MVLQYSITKLKKDDNVKRAYALGLSSGLTPEIKPPCTKAQSYRGFIREVVSQYLTIILAL